MNDIQERDHRRLYRKPALRVVELTSEEVMGTGCKTDSSVAVGNPASCVTGIVCSALGS